MIPEAIARDAINRELRLRCRTLTDRLWRFLIEQEDVEEVTAGVKDLNWLVDKALRYLALNDPEADAPGEDSEEMIEARTGGRARRVRAARRQTPRGDSPYDRKEAQPVESEALVNAILQVRAKSGLDRTVARIDKASQRND